MALRLRLVLVFQTQPAQALLPFPTWVCQRFEQLTDQMGYEAMCRADCILLHSCWPQPGIPTLPGRRESASDRMPELADSISGLARGWICIVCRWVVVTPRIFAVKIRIWAAAF